MCHIFNGQVHTTHRKQGQAMTPTLTMKPARGLHCFPNCQAIFFHVGILPFTTASLLFLTIQLEPRTGMHAQEASGDFLLSGKQALKLRLKMHFYLRPHVPHHIFQALTKPHDSNCLLQNILPIKASGSFGHTLFPAQQALVAQLQS